jgi:predicted enzyme related to lactoylglutathione lyase
MDRPRAGAVVFAKDFANLTRFYVQAFGLTPLTRGNDHSVLGCEGFRLVVHQIPAETASGISIDNPPRRRERGAVKLSFAVDSLEQARRDVATLGGIIDPPDTEWSDGETTTCKGHDPEGNTFNVFAYRG